MRAKLGKARKPFCFYPEVKMGCERMRSTTSEVRKETGTMCSQCSALMWIVLYLSNKILFFLHLNNKVFTYSEFNSIFFNHKKQS